MGQDERAGIPFFRASHNDVDLREAADLTESLSAEIPSRAPVSRKELQTIVTWKVSVKRKTATSEDRDFVFRVIPYDGDLSPTEADS